MSKTSWQVKRRYAEKNYKRITVEIKKDLAEAFDAALKERGDTKAGVIREAIEKYLGQ